VRRPDMKNAFLYAGSALLAAPAALLALQEDDHAGGGGLFSVDPGLMLWTIAVFMIVLWVLGKFAWRPILGALAAREDGIRGSIQRAESMRTEAEKLLAEHKAQLADARRQAQEIVASGREAGDRLKKEIEGKAREEGERMLERARSEIQRERDDAMDTIRREAVELAISAASRLLQQKLDAPGDRVLVEAYLDEVKRPAAEA
jgi:F-type H+-transporting ATPase subunit b